ncbi:MAG: ClbS/DfsB family four-helix bundle protein [Hyphomicrobiales bacterium]
MAVKNKQDLLKITQKEYSKLIKLLESVDAKTALVKDSEDTSIKDVVAHRAHWVELFLGWHADGLAGKMVYFPAKGYKWNDLKRYNYNLRQQQIYVGWDTALVMLDESYHSLFKFIEGCSEQELYGGPMKGANNQWTVGRWAEAAGASHFRSASKCCRAMLKKAQ